MILKKCTAPWKGPNLKANYFFTYFIPLKEAFAWWVALTITHEENNGDTYNQIDYNEQLDVKSATLAGEICQ